MRARSSIACGAVVVCALMTSSSARACGGFFCSNRAIAQAGEQIAFVYEPDGSVTTIVQVQYTGPSESFAWILPVPERPTVSLGTGALFTELWNATAPIFQTVRRTEGTCNQGTGACVGLDPCGLGRLCLDAASADSGVDAGPEGLAPEVRAQTSNVGPFEVAVLEPSDGDALRAWLLDNGYVLPGAVAAELDPYVARGSFFVAFRLRKERSAGEIAPIVIRSSNTEPCVPIRLTSIAAVDDMPVTVYVLADRRTRPLSWLLLSEANLDDARLWGTTQTYAEIVSEVVDAAGGHAFVTDFAGPPPEVSIESDVRSEHIALLTEPVTLVGELLTSDIWMDALPILARHFPVPPGFNPLIFFTCAVAGCRGATELLEAMSFDPRLLAADVETQILAPRREAQAMVDSHAHLTRLFTTLSADEMTSDPTFVLSDELAPIVDRTRTATIVTECSDEFVLDGAPQVLVTPSGARLPIREGMPCAQIGGGSCSASVDGSRPPGLVLALLVLGLLDRRR